MAKRHVQTFLTDREWVAQGKHKITGRDNLDTAVPRWSIGNNNDPAWQGNPERKLMETMLKARIDDALERSGYHNLICPDCHFDNFDCGCANHIVGPNPSRRTESVAVRARGLIPVWVNERTYWVPPSAVGQFDGVTYYRLLRHSCPNAPTYHQCAVKWLTESSECKITCDELGVDWDYLMKWLRPRLSVKTVV